MEPSDPPLEGELELNHGHSLEPSDKTIDERWQIMIVPVDEDDEENIPVLEEEMMAAVLLLLLDDDGGAVLLDSIAVLLCPIAVDEDDDEGFDGAVLDEIQPPPPLPVDDDDDDSIHAGPDDDELLLLLLLLVSFTGKTGGATGNTDSDAPLLKMDGAKLQMSNNRRPTPTTIPTAHTRLNFHALLIHCFVFAQHPPCVLFLLPRNGDLTTAFLP